MKVLTRNKVIFFIIYICISLVVSVILLTMRDYLIAGVVLLLFSAVSGTVFFVTEIKNALKIGIYFLSLLFSALIGYAVFWLLVKTNGISIENTVLVSVLTAFALFIVSLLFRIQEKIFKFIVDRFDNLSKPEREIIDYKTYQRHCVIEWFQSQSNWIGNQSLSMTLIRICGLIVCVSLGIFGILGKAIPVFDHDIIFDRLLYAFFILFGLIYFLAGLRFSAIPSFVTWLLIFSSYFIHLLFHQSTNSLLQHNIIAYSIIVFMFALCITPLLYYLKNEMIYSNVQMYERGDQCVTVDLFISDFIPIIDLDKVLIFDIGIKDYPKIQRDFIQLLKSLVNLMRSHQALFAGYVTHSQTGYMTFYVYANKFTSGLENDIRNKAQTAGFEIENFSIEADSGWDFYKTVLNPDNAELCGIISRSYIEQLFMKGISFDKEYEINFFVNFKDKNDPVDFEKEIKYFGFSLIYASYDDDTDCVDPEYKYYGEYKANSFISYRRIEYLNKLLLDKSEEFGSLYLGEWQIDN